MSYTVWIAIEDEDAKPFEGFTWWSVDHFDTMEEAIAHAEQMAVQEYNRTGVEPQRLDQ
jgi:hypothetical protein